MPAHAVNGLLAFCVPISMMRKCVTLAVRMCLVDLHVILCVCVFCLCSRYYSVYSVGRAACRGIHCTDGRTQEVRQTSISSLSYCQDVTHKTVTKGVKKRPRSVYSGTNCLLGRVLFPTRIGNDTTPAPRHALVLGAGTSVLYMQLWLCIPVRPLTVVHIVHLFRYFSGPACGRNKQHVLACVVPFAIAVHGHSIYRGFRYPNIDATQTIMVIECLLWSGLSGKCQNMDVIENPL